MVPGTDFSREYQGHVLPVRQGTSPCSCSQKEDALPSCSPPCRRQPPACSLSHQLGRGVEAHVSSPCPPGGPSPAGSPSPPDPLLLLQARMVAAATNNLCEAANAAVQGHASEEKLISSAKQVAASTAQLLVACKVKADHDSEAMKRLQVSPRLGFPVHSSGASLGRRLRVFWTLFGCLRV